MEIQRALSEQLCWANVQELDENPVFYPSSSRQVIEQFAAGITPTIKSEPNRILSQNISRRALLLTALAVGITASGYPHSAEAKPKAPPEEEEIDGTQIGNRVFSYDKASQKASYEIVLNPNLSDITKDLVIPADSYTRFLTDDVRDEESGYRARFAVLKFRDTRSQPAEILNKEGSEPYGITLNFGFGLEDAPYVVIRSVLLTPYLLDQLNVIRFDLSPGIAKLPGPDLISAKALDKTQKEFPLYPNRPIYIVPVVSAPKPE